MKKNHTQLHIHCWEGDLWPRLYDMLWEVQFAYCQLIPRDEGGLLVVSVIWCRCSEPVECNEPIDALSRKLGIHMVRAGGKKSRTMFERMSFNGKTSVVKCTYPPHTCMAFFAPFIRQCLLSLNYSLNMYVLSLVLFKIVLSYIMTTYVLILTVVWLFVGFCVLVRNCWLFLCSWWFAVNTYTKHSADISTKRPDSVQSLTYRTHSPYTFWPYWTYWCLRMSQLP